MNITPDYLIERKQTKTQLVKWKIFSLALIVLALFFVNNNLPTGKSIKKVAFSTSDHIASIRISEIIINDLNRTKKLSEIEQNDKVKAVIVNVDSPGGSVVGSEMLYNSLCKISKVKPVVVVMESLAASGGYLISLGGDYIIAHNGTITGSIGVIMQSTEITELANMVGVKFNNFKSNELKGSPNSTEKVSPEVRQATMDCIYKVYDYFIELVATRRNLDIEYVKKIADGRVYSGQQAFDLKLVDAIGDSDTAVKWLHDKRNISKNLNVVDIRLKPKNKFIDLLIKDFQNHVLSFFSLTFKGLKAIL